MPLSLKSAAFADGANMPLKHTRDGGNLLPALTWSGVPTGTMSFALVVDDPDAPRGTFTHFALYDIAADRTRLAEGNDGTIAPGGAKFAVNDFGNARYDRPEPPHGHGMHHYHFRLAALSVPSLKLPARPTVKAVWAEAMRHALATTELIGTYER